MYYSAQLVLTNYKPLHLEKGMWFKNVVYPNTDREYTEIWKLGDAGVHKLGTFAKTIDQFFAINGYPIEILITQTDGQTIATHEQIGWWDEGDQTDELRDITIRDINFILRNNNEIEIDISENAYNIGQIIPTIEEGKVILRFPVEDEENS